MKLFILTAEVINVFIVIVIAFTALFLVYAFIDVTKEMVRRWKQ